LRDRGYNCGLIGKWHVGTDKSAGDFGFDGPDLPGWHNPVDHPDYLAYLAERDLPPYEISDRIRGTLPNGVYSMTATATVDGKPATVTTYTSANVEGVSLGANGSSPMIDVGVLGQISMSQVFEII